MMEDAENQSTSASDISLLKETVELSENSVKDHSTPSDDVSAEQSKWHFDQNVRARDRNRTAYAI